MQQLEVVLGLLVAVSILAVAAERLQVPYPVSLVLGGLGLGFVPGLPEVKLSPDVAFFVFLPPLVYAASQATSLRDLRANLQPIASLAVGLALATAGVVAVAIHAAVHGLGWPAAFVLGAIVAPTDPIAVAAIMHRLHVPRRVLVIVEAESLVNDAVGLVTYRIAVVAAVAGTFSLWQAGLQFVLVSAGGAVIGLAVGWLVAFLHNQLDHTPVEITITLLTPFAAYLPATALGVSGVLAVMAAGLYLARQLSTVLEADTRLQAAAVWEMIVFVLNGLLFILVGLQLRGILADIAALPVRDVARDAAIVCLVVVLLRPLWAFSAMYLPWLVRWMARRFQPSPSWRQVSIISWSGMRGSASIAAALAVPFTTASGSPFPERSLVIFLVFCVILFTLVVQGFSMPWLIRWLGVSSDSGRDQEERRARLHAAKAALARIEQLAAEEWLPNDVFERVHALYRERVAHLAPAGDGASKPAASNRYLLHREGLNAERAALIGLRDNDRIDDDLLRRIERDLDLEEERLRSLGA